MERIVAPHIHYFAKDFFNNLNSTCIDLFLSNKKKINDKDLASNDDEENKFIVYLGKGKFNFNEQT